MSIYIGTSGWSYDHWESVLYPRGLPPRERLTHYVSRYPTVELNASYYRWPSDGSFYYWRRRLPDGFRLSVKAPGLLTHVKRLYGPERWITRMQKGLTGLRDRFGVLLVQLSPVFEVDYPRLAYFLEHMPEGLRVAFEFRHPSWHIDPIFELLERHGAGYCVMSGAQLPCVLRATAGFVYVRLHGPDDHHLYAGSYSDNDLRWWADRIHEWRDQGREVFVYFNNDGHGHAVRNAHALRSHLEA